MGQLKWAVIGGGNGGQSLSGHLALMGFSVRLYDIVPETVLAIQKKGGIELQGAVNGFGKLEFATTRMDEAVAGAEIVAVVAPATAHRVIAAECAPFLQDGQVVFLHPGATGGALEFRKVLADNRCRAEVAIAESNSLIYACRSPQPARADILAIKKELLVAALPATSNPRVLGLLNQAFPQIRPARNVFETSLGNPNAIMHPAPTLLNASLIESKRDWLYYWDGITPSIGDFVETLDRERLSLALAFNLHLPSIREWYCRTYGAVGGNLTEVVRNTQAYAGVKGQKSLRTRYLLEDVPTGLVPMVCLGRSAGVDVMRMESVIRMAGFLLGEDFFAGGRTIDTLGLTGMTTADILRFVETGG
jgi:opine dehydrogenase